MSFLAKERVGHRMSAPKRVFEILLVPKTTSPELRSHGMETRALGMSGEQL